MERSLWRAAAAAAVICAVGASGPALASGNINLAFGQKMIDDTDWSFPDFPEADHSDLVEYGAQVTFGPEEWPVQIAIGWWRGKETVNDIPRELVVDDIVFDLFTDLEVNTQEWDLGVRKHWEVLENGRLRPYVGGGFAQIAAERVTQFSTDDALPEAEQLELLDVARETTGSDRSIGFFVDGGVIYRFGKRGNVGINGRYSAADVTINDMTFAAGGMHLHFLFGWGWD